MKNLSAQNSRGRYLRPEKYRVHGSATRSRGEDSSRVMYVAIEASPLVPTLRAIPPLLATTVHEISTMEPPLGLIPGVLRPS
jgi:hypothetical protein